MHTYNIINNSPQPNTKNQLKTRFLTIPRLPPMNFPKNPFLVDFWYLTTPYSALFRGFQEKPIPAQNQLKQGQKHNRSLQQQRIHIN